MWMTKVILGNLLNKYSTKLHPFEKREMPEAYRGQFKLDSELCIMCQACALKCPTKCITIEPELGLWTQDAMACVHCAVCVEVCPTSCLTMTKEYRSPYIKRMTQEFRCPPRIKKNKIAAAAAAAEAAPAPAPTAAVETSKE